MRSKRIRNYIENGVENALKTVALLTSLNTARFLIKELKCKQQKRSFI
jgi:hypothetical protein